jgi:uncharacterized iron-regulated membrane protein
VFVDPFDARVIGERWRGVGLLGWLERLHFNLLAGRTGLIVNGVAALLLALLCATGLIVWWPGTVRWTRAVRVDWRRPWRQVTFDRHRYRCTAARGSFRSTGPADGGPGRPSDENAVEPVPVQHG